MNLDQIKFFERPLTSGPRDTIVGQSELGPVYQTATGDTYIVSPKEDQRTENEKIRSALGAAKDWVQNPELPEGDDILEFLESTAEGVWDMASIPGDLASGERSGIDVQMGEAMGMAPAMGAASAPFKVPEGSTRIFGGSTARKAPESKRMDAILMKEDGVPDEIIWEDTGWQFDEVNRAWQFEIDPLEIDAPIPQGAKHGSLTEAENWDYYASGIGDKLKESGTERITAPLSKVVNAPKLFENYPQLEESTLAISRENRNFFIAKSDGTLEINVSLNTFRDKERFLDVVTHELQHGVQELEGWERGSAPKYMRDIPELQPLRDEIEEARNKTWITYQEVLDTMSEEELQETLNAIEQSGFYYRDDVHPVVQRYMQAEADYEQLEQKLSDEAFKYYQGNPGEIEARAASGRRYMTDTERAESPPSDTKREMFNKEMGRYKGRGRLQRGYSDQARYSKGGLVQRRTK